MKRMSLLLAAATLLVAPAAFASDVGSPVLKAPVYVAPVPCQSAGNCSGGYLDFGVSNNADLGGTLNGSATNGMGLNFGGGYQLWTGQILAGVEVNGGYEFGTAGSTGGLTSTQFVKLGYNFFPSTQSAAPTAAQNPFVGLVPANLLANSTPSFIFGGALRHGIEQAAVGMEIDTVIAAGWSTAFQYYNAPSTKGQPDESVFRILAQKHF